MCFPCCWPFADVWLEDPPKEKKKKEEEKPKVIWIPYGSGYYPNLSRSPHSHQPFRNLQAQMNQYGYYVPAQHGQTTTYATWKAAQKAEDATAEKSAMDTYHYHPASEAPKPVQSSPTPHTYPYYTYYQWPAICTYYPQYQYYASAQAPGQSYAYYYPYAGAATAASAAPAATSDKHHYWYGRTKEQVDEDNVKIAMAEGVFSPNNMEPANPGKDQQFWVVELDGSHTLRSFDTIKNDLQPGEWARDPRYGNAYFIRKKKD